MVLIWTLLKLIIFTGILSLIAKQSYFTIFLFGEKPNLWIFLMFVLNFLFFLIGSRIQGSINIVMWASLLSIFAINKFLFQPVTDSKDDEFTSKAQLKYRLGQWAFVLGGLIGWILFYGQKGNQPLFNIF